MPGHGLDGPGAERYATGGTQHRRPRAERYTDAEAWPRWPGRNAMPLAERNIDGSGGTLYRCQGMASVASGRNAMPPGRNATSAAPGGTLYRCRGMASMAWAERYATGGTQHRRLQAERYTDAEAWSRWPGRNAMPLAERSIDGSRRNAIPMPGRGLDDPGAERYATGTGSCRVSCGWPLVLSSMR